jgi:hypothetical protein
MPMSTTNTNRVICSQFFITNLALQVSPPMRYGVSDFNPNFPRCCPVWSFTDFARFFNSPRRLKGLSVNPGKPYSRYDRSCNVALRSVTFMTSFKAGKPLRISLSDFLSIFRVQTIASPFTVPSHLVVHGAFASALSPCRASKSIREGLSSTKSMLHQNWLDQETFFTPCV